MKRAATMNIRTFILSSALLVAAPLLARENTDVLVMKNGDRMTCQVKGLDARVLYVSFDYIDKQVGGVPRHSANATPILIGK